ncbi:MAG: hypothetical protein ABII82_12555 [Verrucomicrobiota bacterium]
MSPRAKIYSASAIILASILPDVSAALLVEDQFLTGPNGAAGEYNLGPAVGQSPTNLGYTGGYLNTGFASPEIIGTGLSYTDGTHTMQTAGGAIQSTTAVQHTRVGRLQENPFDSSSNETIYLSFLYQVSATGGYKAMELHNGGFADSTNRVLQIGLLGNDGLNASNFGLRINNNNALRLDFGAADTGVNLFVLKFDLSAVAGGDSVTVYRNPDLDLEPESGVSLTGFDFQFDRISMAKFNSLGFSLTLDEIRLGQAFNDVSTIPASIPEPASFAWLTGLACLAGRLFSRRRA